MKSIPLICLLGLLGSTLTVGHAEIGRQNNILGKFIVTSVNGNVTCVSDGRILDLKKGDTIVARGATVATGANSNAILVFSNGTGVYTDANTQFKIERFDQEFFAPNNNLRVEPSNSRTLAKVTTGRVVLSTPRLLSGTSMVYQTPHASVSVRGEKLVIEAGEENSHIALLSGSATISQRDAEGNFVAVGKRLASGQEALVHYTLSGSTPASRGTSPSPASAPAPGAAPANAAGTAPLPDAPGAGPVARVLQVTGSAHARLPGSTGELALSAAATLPSGSLISTDDDTLLFLQPFPGAIAAILPHSVLEIERLTTAAAGDATRKNSSVLVLRTGSVVSMLDPAGRATNEYSIRTLQGTATARGTVFSASVVQNGGLVVASSADTVTFTSNAGPTYQIAAGNVVLAPPGQNAQPPIPLVLAATGNKELGGTVRQTFATLATVVRNNIGGLSATASAELISQVTATAAVALPQDAENFAAEAVVAIGTPTSTLSGQVSPAIAAVLQAVVAGLPDRAPPTAAAAALATVPQAAVIAAAAAKAAPVRSAQIAAAVSRLVLRDNPAAGLTAAQLQTAAAIAASVAAATPNQAGAIAVATMQAVLEAGPNETPQVNAQRGALIGATVTRAVPAQAVATARGLMQLLTQNLTEPSPQVLAQTGALLAGSIIAVVPTQARPVTTAVMVFFIETYPAASSEWFAEIAGTMAAALAQILPANVGEIYAALAEVLGRSLEDVEALAANFKDRAGEFALLATKIGQDSAAAFRDSGAATDALAAAAQFVQGLRNSPAGPSDIEIRNATSIVITQFDPAAINQLTADLEAAQAAQTTVQFYTETDGNGGTTVRPSPTIPRTLPIDLTVSPSNLGTD